MHSAGNGPIFAWKLSLNLWKWPGVDDDIINVQEIIPGWKWNCNMVPFWTKISLNGRIFIKFNYFFKIQLIVNKTKQNKTKQKDQDKTKQNKNKTKQNKNKKQKQKQKQKQNKTKQKTNKT